MYERYKDLIHLLVICGTILLATFIYSEREFIETLMYRGLNIPQYLRCSTPPAPAIFMTDN